MVKETELSQFTAPLSGNKTLGEFVQYSILNLKDQLEVVLKTNEERNPKIVHKTNSGLVVIALDQTETEVDKIIILQELEQEWGD